MHEGQYPPSSSDRALLCAEIRAAFNDVTRPPDTALVYDTTGGHLECNCVAAAFERSDWEHLDWDTLRRNAQALFFFTPHAYQYFLPAYLLACVCNYDETDVLAGSVVYSLRPPRDTEEREVYRTRTTPLTAQQRGAIRDVMKFLRAFHGTDFLPGELEEVMDSLS